MKPPAGPLMQQPSKYWRWAAPDMDAGRRKSSSYATLQHLLKEEPDRPELMRRFKQVLEHVGEARRLRPSDLQLPIRLSPFDTSISPLAGYEGGEFNPESLGLACVVVPPTEGRGSNTKGTWTLVAVPTPPSPS